ncbi:MAG TPA: hypothetical protein VF397_16065 [Pyrinomonadaceae bacterium]
MSGGTIDWNWFFSSLAQSVAALVGIFAAFIITKIINNQAEFQRKNTRLKELLSLSAKFRDALSDRSFDWYNERRLEYALERLEDVAEDEDFKNSDEYYEEFKFPPYVPRSEVLKKIDEKISEQTAKRNPPPRPRNDFSYMAFRDVDSIRFRTQLDERIRENVNEEGERIRALILEIRQHIRLVKLHLAELEGNPQSSMLINLSIIGAVLLFLLGVIYPLSFLPVSIDQQIRYSIGAFVPILFSLKGFLLSSISIIFLAIIITFW